MDRLGDAAGAPLTRRHWSAGRHTLGPTCAREGPHATLLGTATSGRGGEEMAWWKRKARVSDVCCQVCQGTLPTGSVIAGIKTVHVTEQRTRAVGRLCAACWQRHQSLEAEAEARFRREHPVEEVCARLVDPDVDVRALAAEQLARLGDRRAVTDLCGALGREASPRAFENIAAALGACGGPEAQEALIAVLDDSNAWSRPDHGDDYGRSRVDMVAGSLVTMGGSTLFVRAVLDTLTSGAASPDLRTRVAQELSDIAYRSTGSLGLTPWLAEKLTHADRESMFEPLRAALHDTHAPVRRHTAMALGHLGDARAVEDLTVLLDDENDHVRHAAAQALAKLTG